MHTSIHLFTKAELEVTNEMLKAAYNVPLSRKESLCRYLALQPDGAFVAKHDSMVIGFGGAMDYGPFAYIGLMAVHPGMQKRGVGGLILERLLAWLDERRCPTVLLDATPVGALLYKRHGFIEDDITAALTLGDSADAAEIHGRCHGRVSHCSRRPPARMRARLR